MGRRQIEQWLRQAEENCAKGFDILRAQRDLVTRLQRLGLDTTEALRLLDQFEVTQAVFVADRDRLRRELDELD